MYIYIYIYIFFLGVPILANSVPQFRSSCHLIFLKNLRQISAAFAGLIPLDFGIAKLGAKVVEFCGQKMVL